MRPVFIPEPQIFSKIYWKFTLFSKIVKLSSKFMKFWCQIDEIGPIFASVLEHFENMTHAYGLFSHQF